MFNHNSRLFARGPVATLCAAALFAAAGCSPIMTVAAHTDVRPDGSVQRTVMYAIQPHPRHPSQAVALADHLNFPSKDAYQKADFQPRSVRVSGVFARAADVPVDFMKKTPGTDLLAQNHITVRIRDFALMTVVDYDERLSDIVERVEAEEDLSEATSLFLDALMKALQKFIGADYDLAELDSYLRANVPAFSKRLYGAYWEVRRSRRSVFADDSEAAEFEDRVQQELSMAGFGLTPSVGAEPEENSRRVWQYVDERLASLAKPRRAGVPPLSSGVFRDRERQTEFLTILEASLKETFGSVDQFRARIEPLYASIFGAYTGHSVTLEQTEPSIEFFYRARIPGLIVESNAVRDLDGSLVWRFSNRDTVLTGYRMWARSIIINEEAIQRLQLRDFPRSLTTVEALYDALLTPRLKVDPNRVALLQQCVRMGSLKPLRDAANPLNAGKSPIPTEEAQRLLGIIGSFHDADAAPRAGDAPVSRAPNAVTPDKSTPEAAPVAKNAETAADAEAEAESAESQQPADTRHAPSDKPEQPAAPAHDTTGKTNPTEKPAKPAGALPPPEI